LGCDDFKGQQMLIPACLEFLDRMKDAASKATPSTKSKRGPKGTTGTPAFGAFIESLQMAARQRGGDWTIYRAADQSWTGSLLEAVMILKPYLPNNFLPRSEVGRPVEYNKGKLMEHIRNNLPSAK
jgi:hypothetical protein